MTRDEFLAGQKTFAQGRQLADLFGSIIDRPSARPYSNPTYGGDPGFSALAEALNRIVPGYNFRKGGQFNPQQFGETQNPAQYRGIRMLLPESGGEYRVLKEGRIPGYHALQQALLGEMIRRGYPVLGGTGETYTGGEAGFDPVGFGQRE